MKKKRKLLNLFVAIVAIALVTGCCLLSLYSLIQKYGQVVYFADFWAKTGSNDIAQRISKDLQKYKENPLLLPLPNAEGIYTVDGEISYDDPIVEGMYAKYSSKGNPLKYALQFKSESGNFVFVKMTLNGKVTITDHVLDQVGKAPFISFENTSITQEGAVVDGVVKVGDQELKLGEYSILIREFVESQDFD